MASFTLFDNFKGVVYGSQVITDIIFHTCVTMSHVMVFYHLPGEITQPGIPSKLSRMI